MKTTINKIKPLTLRLSDVLILMYGIHLVHTHGPSVWGIIVLTLGIINISTSLIGLDIYTGPEKEETP